MYQHLIRHFQVDSTPYQLHTELYLRILFCLTLAIPAYTSLTVGRKTKQTSDKYILNTTPPDYFFRIWIVIFLAEIFAAMYITIKDGWSIQLWIIFALINIFSGLWAYSFNSQTIIGLNISVVSQLAMTICNEVLWIGLGKAEHSAWVGSTIGTVIRNIFAFAEGWLLAASALGLCLVLVYSLGVSHKIQTILFWIAAPLVYASILVINIWVVGTFQDTIGLLFSMCWAVLGAGIATYKTLWLQPAKQ